MSRSDTICNNSNPPRVDIVSLGFPFLKHLYSLFLKHLYSRESFHRVSTPSFSSSWMWWDFRFHIYFPTNWTEMGFHKLLMKSVSLYWLYSSKMHPHPTQTPGMVTCLFYLLQPLLHLFYTDPGNGPWKRKADAAFQHCKVCKICYRRTTSILVLQNGVLNFQLFSRIVIIVFYPSKVTSFWTLTGYLISVLLLDIVDHQVIFRWNTCSNSRLYIGCSCSRTSIWTWRSFCQYT